MNSRTNNIIMLTDSYKLSHYLQYPDKTETIHSYLAPRGGDFEDVVFFGYTYYLKEYLAKQFTLADVLEAEAFAKEHSVPFNKAGWEYILAKYQGRLPIIIKALPEGAIVHNKRPLMTIENTDPNCAWLVGYLETLLLKIWYPTTVASKAKFIKDIIAVYYKQTAENMNGVDSSFHDFAYHNFGDRGSTSVESAAIGGLAHLTQFQGTDNFHALAYSKKYYNGALKGFSIPASEHSTVTSWSRLGEFAFYENYLETFKGYPLIACVMDSYNIFEAVDFLTKGRMKDKIESPSYPKWIIRPDSGKPLEVLPALIKILEHNNVASEVNSKGYKVFKKYGFIWGDGVTPSSIREILNYCCNILGYCASNFAFGSGGDIMQNVNRDTLKFAIKCSAIKIDGEWNDVFKAPITDSGKVSIKGRIEDPEFSTVFENGEFIG